MQNVAASQQSVQSSSHEDAGSESLPALSVLVVDDELHMVVELHEALTDQGYVVHAANSAAAAMELLRKYREIGVMISDIRMPECDGIELTRRAFAERTERNALEVILITGHGTVDDAAAVIRNGTFDLLRKPFRLRDIFSTTENAMTRSVARRASAAQA